MSSLQKFDLNNIKDQLEGSVGGDPKDQKALATSFEGLEKVIDAIPLEMTEQRNLPEINSIVNMIIDKEKIDFLKAYTEREASTLNKIANDVKPNITPRDEIEFVRTMQAYSQVSQRLLKIYNLLSSEKIEKNESQIFEDDEKGGEIDQKIQEIVKISKESLADSYAKIFNIQARNISEIPETEEGIDRLRNFSELLKALGILPLMQREITNKQNRMPKEESTSTKYKKRVITGLLRAIAVSQLPAATNDTIDHSGDYFLLFKRLEREDLAWMNYSIKNYVFKNDAKEIADFEATARKSESLAEENQINYLKCNRSWILSYIKSDQDGVLTDREETNYVSQLETACIEKEKEIKNYYLSKGFNLSNVSGLQIKPEIRLPLYIKVKLAVSEKDRIKESPLRNIIGGAIEIVGGLFSRIEDKIDAGALQAAQARNRAIFNGISAIVKGTVGLVGGKQAVRDLEAGSEKIASALNPERITLSSNEKRSKIKEDMISTIDATGFAPVNPEAPGQAMQTPDSMAGTMDTFSLLGPGKKSEPKKKAKTAGSKVLTFADFIKGKSKLD